jgi:Cu/Ag efflux protein CusF
MNYLLVSTLVFALSFFSGASQNFETKTESFVVIKGTSSLHDWDMKGDQVIATAEIILNNDSSLKEIKSFNGEILIENLRSGVMGMDGKAYDALKYEEFPKIKFFLKTIDKIDSLTGRVTSQFNVSIAGVTKLMIIDGVFTNLQNGQLRIIGEKKMKMSDFNVEPPTALFGTIKTGDDIALEFNITMKYKN